MSTQESISYMIHIQDIVHMRYGLKIRVLIGRPFTQYVPQYTTQSAVMLPFCILF